MQIIDMMNVMINALFMDIQNNLLMDFCKFIQDLENFKFKYTLGN